MLIRQLVLAAALLVVTNHTSAAIFNFLVLGPINDRRTELTVDGITLTVGTASGELTSSSTQFGINGPTPDNEIDLIDSGETLGFGWSELVLVDRLFISQLDATDAGFFAVNGGTGSFRSFPLQNGINEIGGVVAGGGTFLRWTGENLFDGRVGFSLDAIEVRPFPEPVTSVLVVAMLTMAYRRQR
ncbi:MAG: hypothetical protein AAGH92_03190 [Planctomycetota bacterium]